MQVMTNVIIPNHYIGIQNYKQTSIKIWSAPYLPWIVTTLDIKCLPVLGPAPTRFVHLYKFNKLFHESCVWIYVYSEYLVKYTLGWNQQPGIQRKTINGLKT